MPELDVGFCQCGGDPKGGRLHPRVRVLTVCRVHVLDQMENESPRYPGEEWAGIANAIAFGKRWPHA